MEKLQSLSNYAILSLQAFQDCELAVVDLSDRNFAVFDFIVAVDHIGKSLSLINTNRTLRHEESLTRLIERQAHPRKHANAQAPIIIGNNRPHLQSPRSGVDLVIR